MWRYHIEQVVEVVYELCKMEKLKLTRPFTRQPWRNTKIKGEGLIDYFNSW